MDKTSSEDSPPATTSIPTIVLAGSSAGVGKTTLTLGISASIRDAGFSVATLKLGPDLLDPVLHASVTGRRGGSLDAWMMTREQNVAAFHRATTGASIAIVEGVMGLFDGRDGVSEDGSTAQMAKWLGAPVVLVVDCDGLGRSAAAVVRGYLGFDPALRIAGVVLNRLSSRGQLQKLQDALAAAAVPVPVLGGLLKDEALEGTQMPAAGCMDPPRGILERISSLVSDSLDPTELVRIARQAEVPPPPARPQAGPLPRPPPRIGVAWDDAFCCYYNTNLSLLSEAGAELVLFSPLSDPLPAGLSAVYIGGGSPELHAEALARNMGCLRALRAFAEAGGVVYAEGGGLLYLGDSIQAPGQPHPCPAVGVFPFASKMAGSQATIGYVEVQTKDGASFLPAGLTVRGHVLHHTVMLGLDVGRAAEDSGDDTPPQHQTSNFRRDAYTIWMGTGSSSACEDVVPAGAVDGFSAKNSLASHVHLHWGSEPRVAAAFLDACQKVDTKAVQAAVAAAQVAEADAQAGPSVLSGPSETPQAFDADMYRSSPEWSLPVASEPSAPPASGQKQQALQGRHSWSSSAERPLPIPRNGGAQAGRPSIASLLPSATEIVFALGLQDRLVGVSSLCDFPPEAANFPAVVKLSFDSANLTPEQVGRQMHALQRAGENPLQLDEELLRRLGPELILAQHLGGMNATRGAAVALSEAPLSGRRGARKLNATTLVLRPRTVADVLETISQVGIVAGVPDQAAALVDHMRNRIRAVALQVASSPRPRPRVVLLQSVSPIVLGGVWLPDVKAMAGGIDPLQEPGDDAQAADWEVIRSAAPDVLIVCPCAASPEHSLMEICALAGMPGWWGLPAVRSGEVYVCRREFFVRPGPRLVDGIEMLARVLHPEAVQERIPQDRALKLTLSGGRRCRQSLLHNYFEPYT